MLNKEYYNNITKLVKIILLENSLYDWYISTLQNNPIYKNFLNIRINNTNDILKEYLEYCFQVKSGYIVYRTKPTHSNTAIFGNIFLLNGDIDYYETGIDKCNQHKLHEHVLINHLHELTYQIYSEVRKKK